MLPKIEHCTCNISGIVLQFTNADPFKSMLRTFWQRHSDSEVPLLAWYYETERCAPYKGSLYLQYIWEHTIINNADSC
jgi:hypothetical protein